MNVLRLRTFEVFLGSFHTFMKDFEYICHIRKNKTSNILDRVLSFVGSKSPKNVKFSALFCKKTTNIKLSYGVKFLNDLATSKYNFDQDAHKISNASLRAPRCARIHMLDLQIKYSNEKSRFYLHTEIDFDFFELKFKVRTLKSRFNEFGPYA